MDAAATETYPFDQSGSYTLQGNQVAVTLGHRDDVCVTGDAMMIRQGDAAPPRELGTWRLQRR